MRVKWQDHFGGELTLSKTIEGDETKLEEMPAEGNVSWSDRKKRDRLREKELLSKVKYVFDFCRFINVQIIILGGT
jgi:hypothetical protein